MGKSVATSSGGLGKMKNKVLIFWDDAQYLVKAEVILQRLIEKSSLDYDDYEMVKTPMPKGKKYGKRDIEQLTKWAAERIDHHKCKFVVAMGSNSFQAVTGAVGIKKARGKPVEHGQHILLPMYHPNMVVHDPDNLGTLEADFGKLNEIMEFGGIPEERELDVRLVTTQTDVREMLADLKGCVASDTETTRLYPFTTVTDAKIERGEKIGAKEELQYRAAHREGKKSDPLVTILPRVVALQFGTAKYQWVIPMETAGIWSRKELEEIVEKITERLEDCYLVGHNWKFDALWMKCRFGVTWDADFDTMLGHYLLDENDRHGLKYLAQKLLGAADWDVDGSVKTSWSEKNAKYAAHDVYYTRKLKYYLAKKLKHESEVKKVFDKIMMPCSALFTEAEFDGISIDIDKMDDAEDYLIEELEKATKKLEKWAHPSWAAVDPNTGKPTINWGSPQQLGRLLFQDLDIEPIALTPTGNPSTSESVLNQIDHPLVGALIQFRGHKQQLSFFIDGWKPFLGEDNKLHPSFKLIGTVTGRLSCERPNLQQVPRDPRIRSLIIAPDGWELMEADLSQIELRIAADLADEHTMLMAFRMKIDVHWLTAMREIERGAGFKDEIIDTAYRYDQKKYKYSEAVELMLKIGPDLAAELNVMWKELRKKAKAINFGYLYGMWWKKFKIYARDNYQVDVTDDQAQQSRKAFFALYGRFPKWHERQKRFARLHGYVRSLSGRKRRLPDAMDNKDTPRRREAERQAINSPVQSFANELNLMSAIQIRKEFGRRHVRLVGTVHDSCLLLVRRDMVETVYKRVLEIMSAPSLLTEFEIELNVPIEAEAKIGPWSLGVRIDKWLKAQKEAA
jgi:uracil-DNA glycosylase family 4